jgi:hypothetical protein
MKNGFVLKHANSYENVHDKGALYSVLVFVINWDQ